MKGSTVTFAEFVIDLEAAELRRNGRSVKIEPQVFDLIVFLASNRGRVLSKEDIVNGVWHGRAVSDSAISTRINAARRALGDDGTTQKFIKTVHGRGFRFEVVTALDVPQSRPAPTHNLVAPGTEFVGRERELASTQALIGGADVRLVSLTGVGGVGKTRLALHTASTLASDFQDGVWFVDLAPLRDAGLVVSAIARTLGVQEHKDRPLAASLHEYLGSRELLLVLDNFEHVLSAANVVSELLAACTRVKVLVTSRATLRLFGEHELRIPPMTLPSLEETASGRADTEVESSEAVRLFSLRARAARPDLTTSAETKLAIAEICLRLDGLPLAIELAAARVRLLTPSELLGRLSRRLPILSAGPRDSPDRQQTLRNTILWSYELLDANEQGLFNLLSVFVGGFTPAAVEAVNSEAQDEMTVVTLGSLFEKSLIQRAEVDGQTRFTLLETLREFASERLAATSEANAVQQRHARYFLQIAEAGAVDLFGARQEESLTRLAREHDNLRAALRSSLEQGGDIELGSRLVGALWWFWSVRGHFTEGRWWTEQAMQVRDHLSPRARAGVLRAMANFAFLQGDYELARSMAKHAVGSFEDLRLGAEATWLRGLEGIAVQYLGDVPEARRLLDEALAIARPLRHDWTTAWMLRNLGRVAHDFGDDAEARRRLEESLQLTRQIGDIRGIALSLHYLGVITLDRNAQEAEYYLANSVASFRTIDDRRGLAWALHYQAAAALALGQHGIARKLETESLILRKDLDDKRGLAECFEGHASRLTAERKAAVAIHLFSTAAAMRETLGTPGSPADRQRVQRYLDEARAALGARRADEIWLQGRQQSVQYAIEVAAQS